MNFETPPPPENHTPEPEAPSQETPIHNPEQVFDTYQDLYERYRIAQAEFFEGLRRDPSSQDIRTHHREVLAELSAQMPELNEGNLRALDIAPFSGQINDQLLASFKKEDGVEVNPHNFRICTDGEDKNWLLKSSYFNNPNVPDHRHNIQALSALEVTQRDLRSQKIAKLLDYPRPASKMVQMDDQVWLASEYLEGAQHVDMREIVHNPGAVSNGQHVINRLPFQFVTGDLSDSIEAGQGIVHEGKYYAIDTGADFSQPSEKHAAHLKELIHHDATYQSMAHAALENPEAVEDFLQRVRGLDEQALQQIYAKHLLTRNEKAIIPARMKEYASSFWEALR